MTIRPRRDSSPATCSRAAVSALLVFQLLAGPFAWPPGAAQAVSGQSVQSAATPDASRPLQTVPAASPQPSGEPIGSPSAETLAPVTANLPAALPAAAAASSANSSPLSRDEQILHLLNRFTYGPRPGDLERVRAQGAGKWLSAQFNPQTLDDSPLERRLADYPAMQLPIPKLMEQYPNNQMIRATMAGNAGRPGGEAEKAIYNAQEQRYKERIKKGADAADARAGDPEPLPDDPQTILAMDPKSRFSELCHLSPAQMKLLRQQLSDDGRSQLTRGFTPRQMEELAAVASPQGVVGSELIQTKLLRDIYTERQLDEVMTDFWLNHFNVFLRKSQEAPYFITSYERDTIRPHALGHFENLLVATAISPAMLNYLDNASSIGPHSPSLSPLEFRRFPRQQARNSSGLNENYAREVMELHTLGVNGGYTQHDVTEVAKVFTGWTLDRTFGQRGGPAVHAFFDPTKHEPGTKTVLGVAIKENGSKEGMQVLHMLATSPQTAHFISTKLAIRFVSDDPPPALVERMAAAFRKTNGDIRQVLLSMISAPEFFTREAYRGKVKTPQDYVVSALRASGAEVVSAGALGAIVAELGMPVYGMQTPNGYSMRADPWNNTAALVSRMNFALAFSANRVAGVHTELAALINAAPAGVPGEAGNQPAGQPVSARDPAQTDAALEQKLLHVPVSERTRRTILAQISTSPEQQQASLRQIAAKNAGRDPLTNLRLPEGKGKQEAVPDPEIALAAGLLLGSPEFQRR